jgi:hypothetical protein
MTIYFAKVPLRAARDPRLRAADHRVLIAICCHANADGLAYPSLACIAAETGIARDNVPRSIARLEEFGYLRHQRHKRGPGLWDRSSYEIIYDSPAGAGATNGGASLETPRVGVDVAESGFPHEAPIIKQDGPSRQSNEKSRQVAEDMLAIWRQECGDALQIPRSLDRDRVTACQARFQDSFSRNVEQWRALCREIRQSPFCCGKGSSGWRADFDWALKPKSIRNVLEGKYRDDRPARSRGNGTYDGIPPLGPGGT